jgi:hypothetical protein
MLAKSKKNSVIPRISYGRRCFPGILLYHYILVNIFLPSFISFLFSVYFRRLRPFDGCLQVRIAGSRQQEHQITADPRVLPTTSTIHHSIPLHFDPGVAFVSSLHWLIYNSSSPLAAPLPSMSLCLTRSPEAGRVPGWIILERRVVTRRNCLVTNMRN